MGCWISFNPAKVCTKEWRHTFAGGWFETPMLILNNNQLQLLNGKGVIWPPLTHLSDIYAHGMSFVPVWKVIEANRCEKSTILLQISVVDDLHEESGLTTQQIITNSITLLHSCRAASGYISSEILRVAAVVEWPTWLFLDVTNIWEWGRTLR